MQKEQSFISGGLTTMSNDDMGIDVEEMSYITPLSIFRSTLNLEQCANMGGQLNLFLRGNCQIYFEEHRVSRIDVEYYAYLWCFNVFIHLMQGGQVIF